MGVTGSYESGDHHLRKPAGPGAGPLDAGRERTLRAADQALPGSHLAAAGLEHHAAQRDPRDERYRCVRLYIYH